MPILHLMLALAVVFIWGTNFVVIKWGLAEFEPFFFAALRFALCVVALDLLHPAPAEFAWSRLAWFGVLLGAGQFGLLFLAMRADVTPGLASLVMQSQVFFTIGLSMALQGERVKGPQYLAMLLAVAGIAVIGWQSLGSGQASVTPLGLSLLLCAAACLGDRQPGCATGRQGERAGLHRLEQPVFAAAAHVVGPVLSWLARDGAFAYSRQHRRLGSRIVAGAGQYPVRLRDVELVAGALPAATVAPMALLVPVFGMSASAWLLAEPLQAWKLIAAALVIAGLALNFYASQRPARA